MYLWTQVIQNHHAQNFCAPTHFGASPNQTHTQNSYSLPPTAWHNTSLNWMLGSQKKPKNSNTPEHWSTSVSPPTRRAQLNTRCKSAAFLLKNRRRRHVDHYRTPHPLYEIFKEKQSLLRHIAAQHKIHHMQHDIMSRFCFVLAKWPRIQYARACTVLMASAVFPWRKALEFSIDLKTPINTNDFAHCSRMFHKGFDCFFFVLQSR